MNIETLAQRYRDLPPNWTVVPLGDVLADIVGGGTPSRNDLSYWNGEIPWLTVKDMRTTRPSAAQEHITARAVAESATSVIPPDTVITATRVGLGKVVRVPFAAAINQDLKALIVRPELDKSYLEYWILSIATFLESIGSGTTVKGIRLETLRQLPFPLAPLERQREIVAEIEKQFSRLDEAVVNLKRVKANLKRYKAAVLDSAVGGRLVSDPKAWSDVTMEQVCEIVCGFAFRSADFERADGVPAIKIANIGYGEFVWKNQEFLPASFVARYPAFSVKPGDILLALTRPITNGLTKVCLYPDDAPGALLNQRVAILRARESALTDYMLTLLQSNLFKGQLNEALSETLQPNLSPFDLKRFRFRLPGHEAQRRIVAEVDRRLSLVRGVEGEVDANLKRAERLRQSVLKTAFGGTTPGNESLRDESERKESINVSA